MERNQQRINEIVYGAYEAGYYDAVPAMIRMVRDLGLINDQMAKALHELIFRGDAIQPEFNLTKAAEIAEKATEEIMKM